MNSPAHWRYSAYGCLIRSEIELPELTVQVSGPDNSSIFIRRRTIQPRSDEDTISIEPDGAFMQWAAVGRFKVSREAIDFDLAPGVTDALAAFPLLGPVLAVMLHLRGRFLLHASAVSVAGLGVVVMGDKGAGKSSTAAALVGAGQRLLCDDLVVADSVHTGPTLPPGFGQLKLSDAALSLVRQLGRERPTVHDAIDKTRLLLHPEAVERQTRPLRALCVVERADEMALEPLDPSAALQALLKFSYMARFEADALRGAAQMQHLTTCAALAGMGFVYRLQVPHGLDRLTELSGFLERRLQESDAL